MATIVDGIPQPPPTPVRLSLTPAVLGQLTGIVAVLSWGSYLALARAGVNGGLQPSDFLVLRFGTAGLFMLPFLLLRWPALRILGFRKAVALTLLAGPPFILLGVGGYAFAPLAHGAVLQPVTVTIFGLASATILLGKTLTLRRLAGVAAAVAGVALVGLGSAALDAGAAGQAWIGDLLFVAAGLLWVGFTICLKRLQVDPVLATATVSVLSALVVLPGFALTDGVDRLAALTPSMLVAQVVVQGVLSGIVAVLAYGMAVKHLGAGPAALFPSLVPVAAVLIGVPVTGEAPSIVQIAGLIIATLGLLFAMGVRRPR